MTIKKFIETNDRVYVDNNKLAKINPQLLTQKEKSKLVITPKILGEYHQMKRRCPQRDSLVNSLSTQTIHKLAHESKKPSMTYATARNLMTTISLETLRKDLQNSYMEEISKLHTKTKGYEIVGELVKGLSRLGAASLGLIGLVYLDKFSPFNFVKNSARKTYNQKLGNLKKDKNPEALLEATTKKRKKWVKKNLERITSEVGEIAPNFDPTRPFNYTDQDMITLAALDSQVNDYEVGIWTEDKDFRKHFELMNKLFSGEGTKLNLYLNPNGDEFHESVRIPNQSQMFNASWNYLEKELQKDDQAFRKLISKAKFYKEISPKRELLYGGINSAIAVAGASTLYRIGEFTHKLYEIGMLDDFIKEIYTSSMQGDYGAFRVGTILASMTPCLPLITYNAGKKAYNNIKTAIKYPKVD